MMQPLTDSVTPEPSAPNRHPIKFRYKQWGLKFECESYQSAQKKTTLNVADLVDTFADRSCRRWIIEIEFQFTSVK